MREDVSMAIRSSCRGWNFVNADSCRSLSRGLHPRSASLFSEGTPAARLKGTGVIMSASSCIFSKLRTVLFYVSRFSISFGETPSLIRDCNRSAC